MIKSLILIFLFCSVGEAKDLSVVFKNNMAKKKIDRERVLDAYEDFVGLLARSPFDPTLQFNVGSSLTLLGEKDKAPILYRQLLTQVNELLDKKDLDKEDMQELLLIKFAIHYNLGVLHQAEQQIVQALENYQAALDIKPDSHEIKTNIEMMFGQGGGKGDKDKKDKGEGEGDDQKQDQKDQQGKDDKEKDKEKEKKPETDEQKKEREKQEQGKKQQREFDQKQMSMEDLKRIMEELKQQEQGIRAKFQGKGGKNGKKEKEW